MSYSKLITLLIISLSLPLNRSITLLFTSIIRLPFHGQQLHTLYNIAMLFGICLSSFSLSVNKLVITTIQQAFETHIRLTSEFYLCQGQRTALSNVPFLNRIAKTCFSFHVKYFCLRQVSGRRLHHLVNLWRRLIIVIDLSCSIYCFGCPNQT